MNINLRAYIPFAHNTNINKWFEVKRQLVRLLIPIISKVLYHLSVNLYALYLNRFRRKPAISSLSNLSPLSTIHPSIMQHTRVQSSKINLIMDISLDFGSYLKNSSKMSTCINYAFHFKLCLLFKYTNGPMMQKVYWYNFIIAANAFL